jgi:hypothetical protein
LQLQPVDADSVILRIEKKNPLFGHFSRRGNPLQSPSLFFKVKICPFYSAKIDHPPVNSEKAIKNFPPKGPQSKIPIGSLAKDSSW